MIAVHIFAACIQGDLLIQVEPVIETVLKMGLNGNLLDKVKIESSGR